MDLKSKLNCLYGSEVTASELAALFGIDLIELHEMIAQSRGEKFDNDSVLDFAVPTHEVAGQIIAQETSTPSQNNGSK